MIQSQARHWIVVVATIMVIFAHAEESHAQAAVSDKPELVIRLGGLEPGDFTLTPSGPVFPPGSSRATERLTVHTPDEKTVAREGDNETVELWDVATKQLMYTLRGASKPLDFSPDGKTLATSSREQRKIGENVENQLWAAKVWDVQTGQLRHALPDSQRSINHLIFSSDSRLLATVSNGLYDKIPRAAVMKIWDLETGKLKQALPEVPGLADYLMEPFFSPQGQTFISLNQVVKGKSSVSQFTVWDVATGRARHTLSWTTANVPYGDPFFHLLADRQSLAVGVPGRRRDGAPMYQMRLWNLETGQPTRVSTTWLADVSEIRMTPDGRFWALKTYFEVQVWDVAAGKLRKSFAGDYPTVGFSPDNKVLRIINRDGEVQEWEIATARLHKLHKLERERVSAVVSLGFSHDGKRFATATTDEIVRVWNFPTIKLLRALSGQPHSVSAFDFAPNGKLVASGGGDGSGALLQVWDVETGKGLWQQAETPEKSNGPGLAEFGEYWVTSLKFSPDSKNLAIGSALSHNGGLSASLTLWDARNGKFIRPVGPGVQCTAFSPDAKLIASGGSWSDDNFGAVSLWNVKTGQLIRQFGQRTSSQDMPQQDASKGALAFSPDSKILANAGIGKDYTIKLWNVTTGALLHTLIGHEDVVRSLAFSLDGSLLASGSDDNTVRLWDTSSGQLLRALEDGYRHVDCVTFTPNSKLLVSASPQSGVIKFWNPNNGRLTAVMMIWTSSSSSTTHWIVCAPEAPSGQCYYDASPGAAKFIRWRVGNQLFPAAKFEKQFHRPDLVQKALRGE